MARCAAPPPSSSESRSPSMHPRALFRTCGNSTMIALASSGRSHGQTRCGYARRQRIVRCKSRAPCSARWARELGRGQCTRNRRPCVPSVSSHCVARADTPADRLARTGVHVSRCRCSAQRVRGGASVDGAPERERAAQGAPRCRVRHCGARRVGQLVYVVPQVPINYMSHILATR